MAVMRNRKDGGCSMCNASDENVGKKRCCHVLDNAAMQVRSEKGTNFSKRITLNFMNDIINNL